MPSPPFKEATSPREYAEVAGPTQMQSPPYEDAGPAEELYSHLDETEYGGWPLSTVEEEEEPGLLDTTLPENLPAPIEPIGNVFGYRTPERVKALLKSAAQLQTPYSPLIIPCDIECSPILLHEAPEDFPEIGDSPGDLIPPSPPSFLVAEQGSPQMLQGLSPQQVYGVHPFDDAMLSPEVFDVGGEYLIMVMYIRFFSCLEHFASQRTCL